MQQPPTGPPIPSAPHGPHGEHLRGPEYRSKQSTSAIFSLNVAHNLTQLCLGFVIIQLLGLATYFNSIFSILKNHIILCTVGYFILMAQAMLSFGPVGWANNLKQEHTRIIYALMQTIGSILAIAGTLIPLIDNDFILDNAHGICGLVAMILTMINFITEILNFIFSQKSNTKYLKILHSSLGTVTIFVAFISLILAIYLYFWDVFFITVVVLALIGTIFMAVVNTLVYNLK